MNDHADNTIAKVLEEIAAEMPPLVTRDHPRFRIWTGVGGRRMANLDCVGLGPAEKVLLGRRVCYPREALLQWVEARLKAA